MFEIPMERASEEFAECWQAAGAHLQRRAQGPIRMWLKADLFPPFLEHLSFRLGNQLFFVRLEDADGRLEVPGNRDLLMTVAEGCKGFACLMPMKKELSGWSAELPGWGLIDARTDQLIDPVALISEELIEMTDWELQDLAVQIVRERLEKERIMSYTSDPRLDPSVWFNGAHGPEWVVVRAVRFPSLRAAAPANWAQLAEGCARLGRSGHFASVAVANADDAFDLTGQVPATPLWRGHKMRIRYEGLEPGPAAMA